MLVEPGNQLCNGGDTQRFGAITSTPKLPKERSSVRRKLFEDKQFHYVTTCEISDSFTKPDYEIHPIKCKQSTFLSAGESSNIPTNVIITEAIGKVVGFLSISGNPPCYWLESMTNHCFGFKTGVLSGEFVGGLNVSVIKKMSESIVIKEGTNLGFLEFHKFI